jgi:hypothetical protein
MNLKEQLSNDLDIFYNSNEFGVVATYKTNEIVVIYEEDVEINNTENRVISGKASDFNTIAIGDIIEIEGVSYEIYNFEFKDNYKLEYLIGLRNE